MAVEAKRGCGFRKVGGLYLMGEGLAMPCPALPFRLNPCSTCGHVLKAARAIAFKPKGAIMPSMMCEAHGCVACPLAAMPPDQPCGLQAVSQKFYTPQSFRAESESLGVSRRISAIPRELEIGKTWVFLAYSQHKTATLPPDGAGFQQVVPDDYQEVFYAFRPSRIELVVSPSWKAAHAEQVAYHEKKGVVLVEVPDDDPDHQPRTKRKAWQVKPERLPLFTDNE